MSPTLSDGRTLQALILVETVHEDDIPLIGRNPVTLQTSTEARLWPGFMVQMYTTETGVQYSRIIRTSKVHAPQDLTKML